MELKSTCFQCLEHNYCKYSYLIDPRMKMLGSIAAAKFWRQIQVIRNANATI